MRYCRARSRRCRSKRCARQYCGCFRWCSRFTRHFRRFQKCLRRHVGRRSRFRFDFRPQRFGRVRIAHAFPTPLHSYFPNLLFDARWRRCGLCLDDYRGRYFDDSPFHDGLRGLGSQIDVHSALDTQTLDRLLCLTLQLVVVRPVIHDGRVVIREVRDVHRLTHDGDILLRTHDYRRHLLRSKLARWQK